MRWLVLLVAATGIARAEPRRELRVASIYRNLEEPGRYAPANLFDGKADTAYCAALGASGSVLVTLPDDDGKLLAKVATVDIATTGTRKTTLLLFYNGSLDRDRTVTGTGTLHVAYPAPKPGFQLSIEVQLEPADKKHPACASELVFSGAGGPIALPGLAAIVERSRARDAGLAAASDNAERAKLYVSSFDWWLRNPAKETSTWESESYVFAADGTYTSTRYDLMYEKPLVGTGTWSIADHGKTLVMGSGRLALHPCGSYTCAGELTPLAKN